MELEDLGFSGWFQDRLKESPLNESGLARIITVHKDNYIVRNKNAEVSAAITGKLMYGAESSLDFPAVGDWVGVHYFNENTLAVIHSILPRKSLLKRKAAGKQIDYQLIASNIDTAFIIQSGDFDFNLRRLERYLILVYEGGIKPVMLVSKSDLITPEELKKKMLEIKNIFPDLKIIAFSNTTEKGLDEIQHILERGKTYCLLGSSGVGKTTLINRLIGEDIFATNEVREKNGKGRHVTARRQMVFLEERGMIIDTPGMRELGNIKVETGIDETFADIVHLAVDCRYKNCTHTGEPGCSILEAVNNGVLNAKRYRNYLKLRRESEYYEMSYLEKRKKDKEFGKKIKSMMKTKKKI
ncbi:MAG: ribosome small subunit-dependent GTPase A [Candidatus Aminicenantes bacterium]|jgi:ribosome biogenesis GTPase